MRGTTDNIVGGLNGIQTPLISDKVAISKMKAQKSFLGGYAFRTCMWEGWPHHTHTHTHGW